MRAYDRQVEVLVFYFGLSPRQLISLRCVCQRWRALLQEERFWLRHHAALRAQLPRIEAALSLAVPREMKLSSWYRSVSLAVLDYFEGDDDLAPRNQALWEALILAAARPQDPPLCAVMGSQCATAVNDTMVVALAWRHFKPHEMQLRRWSHKRQRRMPLKTPYFYIWGQGTYGTLEPRLVVCRLLTLLLDPERAAQEHKKSLLP